MVHVISHISGYRRTWCINKKDATVQDVLEVLREKEGQISDVVLQSGNQILTHALPLSNDATVVATLRLPGGKGGFGSMLRAIGAQIEKTTNREACRDLSGRRLRDINEEKRLKDFISKKAEREREVQERKRQKFEKLKETPRHIFQDESYYQQRELREKNLFDSLDKAFSNEKNGGPSGVKRSCEGEGKAAAKLKKGRFMDDLDESSDESGSDDDSTSDSERKSNSSDISERKGSSSDEDITSSAQIKASAVTEGIKQTPLTSSNGEEVSSSTAGREAASGSEEKQPEALGVDKS